ncbi:prenylated flavin chaperone LpdD [Methanotorris igneus]|uniref:Prenylated flavin chaperone LpdD-like domain-containing protein n=1 Tax=Methanotorris igneus (strain DSM 5666 / JCM 11834 / Kol 5) TaxID=880724 RepID=F6BE91_METIK|nr:hypothetical protein [Methanotorris igneus]AEF96768.1 hypothetical protein Metig_1231 [Methanotorris igneus Kol 5]
MIVVEEGRYGVFLKHIKVGDDLVVIIGGGEKEHIGSVSLMDGKLKTINRDNHKDYVISEYAAKLIYEKIKKPVLVICGIHIDNAKKEEIDILVNNAKKCIELFLMKGGEL